VPNSAARSKNGMAVGLWRTFGAAKFLIKATVKTLLGPKIMKQNATLKTRMAASLKSFHSHEDMINVVDFMLLHPKDVRDLLPSINTVPIAFVSGEEDRLNPPKKHIKHVNKYFQQTNSPSVVVIENSGHLTPFDHPKEFAAETAKFLATL
jgi:pimeloyl-ACP methyl ester carboxylesterase